MKELAEELVFEIALSRIAAREGDEFVKGLSQDALDDLLVDEIAVMWNLMEADKSLMAADLMPSEVAE